MTDWNYRMVHDPAWGFCAIYEVTYDEAGEVDRVAAEPSPPAGKTEADLREDSAKMMEALERPMLEMPEMASEEGEDPNVE